MKQLRKIGFIVTAILPFVSLSQSAMADEVMKETITGEKVLGRPAKAVGDFDATTHMKEELHPSPLSNKVPVQIIKNQKNNASKSAPAVSPKGAVTAPAEKPANNTDK